MENELEQYLSMAFEGLEGYVYSPIKTTDRWIQRFFEFPRERELLTDWIRANALNSDADVYISPVVYNSPHAVKETFKTSQVVWVEFDGDRYIEFPANIPKPTAIVQTSLETHCHCYWQIDPVNSITLEDINRRLTFHLQADQSGWDCTQLLRPPGTFNRKRDRPVLLANYTPVGKFTAPDFDKAPKLERTAESTVVQAELLPIRDVLAGKELSSILIKQVRVESPGEPNRSSFLAKMANELAEEEFTHLEIVSCLYEIDSRIKKFTGRSDQLVRLSQIADYALAKYLASEQITVYTPNQILEHTEDLEWILLGLLHTTGQMIVSSAPGVGKTQFLLQLSYQLEQGKLFLEFGTSVSTPHTILFMSLEMDIRTLKYIFTHQKHEWDSPPASLFVIDETSTIQKYEKLIESIKPTVVVIDSLTELLDSFDGDNVVAQSRSAMKWCRRMRRQYQTAFILIHHNRKATEGNKKPKTLSDLAGSFQFAKDSDTVIQLWEDHKGLEFSTVKTRFGPRQEFLIVRNQNLWFKRKEDASNRPEPVQSDTKGTTGFSVSFGGHGDKLHGQAAGEISPGTSDND